MLVFTLHRIDTHKATKDSRGAGFGFIFSRGRTDKAKLTEFFLSFYRSWWSYMDTQVKGAKSTGWLNGGGRGSGAKREKMIHTQVVVGIRCCCAAAAMRYLSLGAFF